MNPIDPQIAVGRRKAILFILPIAVVWVVMMAGDWYFRFSWFKWHKTWVLSSAAVFNAPEPPLQKIEVPERWGGDLAVLTGGGTEMEPARQRYPAMTWLIDEFGYRNTPPTTNTYYPIAVVGDSYMANAMAATNVFASRLSACSGLPVYNHAAEARGPTFAIQRFLEADRFRKASPRILIWGIVERNIDGARFFNFSSTWQKKPADAAALPKSRILWETFMPDSLKKALPDSSALAMKSRLYWARIRSKWVKTEEADVVLSSRLVCGQPFLFYREAMSHMKWGEDKRRVDLFVDSLVTVNKICRERGLDLVIVLIPDREQIYRDYLPWHETPPESCLVEAERELNARGVDVLNLLPIFREKAQDGILLYWPDDTHWNNEGIQLAAALTWAHIKDRLAQPRENETKP